MIKEPRTARRPRAQFGVGKPHPGALSKKGGPARSSLHRAGNVKLGAGAVVGAGAVICPDVRHRRRIGGRRRVGRARDVP
jgi:hypothetical protein